MTVDGFFYLATVYSKHPQGFAAACVESAQAAAEFVRAGVCVFSPITHTHPIAIFGSIDPLDHSIWLPFDEPFMRLAKGLIVVTSKGWSDSVGIAHEIRTFAAQQKPIFYWQPGTPIPASVLIGYGDTLLG